MPVPHTAKSAMLSCIDDRLVVSDTQFIQSLTGGAFHAKMAGGAAALLNPETRNSALLQLVAAYKINHTAEIYLESHTDCGAYRLAGVTFADREAELRRLFADLDTAADIVRQALQTAGASTGEPTIHLRVVNPAGQLQTRPIKAPVLQAK